MLSTTISFYIAIGIAIILCYLVLTKIKKKEEKPGCAGTGFIIAGISTVSILFFTFLFIFINKLDGFVNFPRYEATIVDVESEWVKFTDGNNSTKNVLMYTAIVEFEDDKGKLVHMPNNLSHGEKPEIGDIITVSYEEGKLQEFSLGAFGMFYGLAIMLFILGYALVYVYSYSTNLKLDRLNKSGANFGLFVFIPSAMLLLLGGMLYGLWDFYLGNKNDMPLFVVITVCVFSIILSIVLYKYLKNVVSIRNKMFKKKKKSSFRL